MNSCSICEKSFKKQLCVLQCCQKDSESQYQLCVRCINRCRRCPFCRSEKSINLGARAISLEIEYLVSLNAAYRRYTDDLIYCIGCEMYNQPFKESNSSTREYIDIVMHGVGIIVEQLRTSMAAALT